MKIINFFVLLGLFFFNLSLAEAGSIPYCTKKIRTGCVRPKPGQTAKFYSAPKYKEKAVATHLKKKPKKQNTVAKNMLKKSKLKNVKRAVASHKNSGAKRLKTTKKKVRR